ncbi:MAG: protoporphyrinogen oxidase [Planctomycetes bacterium]|nr:protoporphyrinogen oxidase [Planctomycetota bacterium]
MVQPRTVIVGAGLTGLACAFDIARAGSDVRVFERRQQPGGVVGTIARDGFLFETGPNTIQGSSAAFLRLVSDLDLASRLIHTGAESATRWLWFQGRLVALPRSPLGLLTTPVLSRSARLRLATEVLRGFVPPEDEREPTFEAFLTERIGREATQTLAGAFVRGIYAADLSELGARSAFPRLWDAAVRRGGLVRGLLLGRKKGGEESRSVRVPRTSLVSFPDGLQELVGALRRDLGSRVRTGVGVERIERFGSGWNVATSDGSSVFADRVVLAVQAPAARVLLERANFEEEARALAAIGHASVTVVHLAFASGLELPRGFGYLVPPAAEARGSMAPRALGTIFTSNLFPGRAPSGGSSCASFYRTTDVNSLSDNERIELARADLRLALARTDVPHPTAHHIQCWDDVIPRLAPGHDRRMTELTGALRERCPSLHLAGSYIGGVSVDSVIATGRATARDVLRRERRA